MCSHEDTYERHFWGFSAKELSTGLRSVILEIIQDLVENMLTTCKKRSPEELWPAISSSCQTLHEEGSQKAAEHIQTLEAYIQENFRIPPHVLLPEDSVQRQQYSDKEREDMDKEIKDLQRRINRVHFMEYHLLQQLEKNKELKTISENVKTLPLPEVETLRKNKDLQHTVLETMGLEVEAASCHLKDEDSEGSGEFNQPNHALKVFKKKRSSTA